MYTVTISPCRSSLIPLLFWICFVEFVSDYISEHIYCIFMHSVSIRLALTPDITWSTRFGSNSFNSTANVFPEDVLREISSNRFTQISKYEYVICALSQCIYSKCVWREIAVPTLWLKLTLRTRYFVIFLIGILFFCVFPFVLTMLHLNWFSLFCSCCDSVS